jgi:hypothetical protein
MALELGSLEGVTGVDVTAAQPRDEPTLPLGGSAMGEGLWTHPTGALALQGVIANAGGRI